MNKIKTIELDGDKISLKKSKSGWRIIYPIKNEDGTVNWKNVFKFDMPVLLLTIAIILLIIWSTNNVNHLLSCFDSLDKLEVCKRSFGGAKLGYAENWTYPLIK